MVDNLFIDGPLCGFDSETTGVDVYDVENTKIVSFSMILKDPLYTEPRIKEWLLNPEIEIPSGASDVHGITTEHAREFGMNYVQGIREIMEFFHWTVGEGIPLVAYNGAFDLTLLKNQAEYVGVESPEGFWDSVFMLDPLVMDRAVDQYRKGKRTLSIVASLHGYSLEDAHEATADVLATLHVAEALVPKYLKHHERNGRPINTKSDMMMAQKFNYMQSARSLEAYFRRTDPNKTLNKSWPIQDKEQ